MRTDWSPVVLAIAQGIPLVIGAIVIWLTHRDVKTVKDAVQVNGFSMPMRRSGDRTETLGDMVTRMDAQVTAHLADKTLHNNPKP